MKQTFLALLFLCTCNFMSMIIIWRDFLVKGKIEGGTWEYQASNMDPSILQAANSLLSPAGYYYADPALSNRRGLSSVLKLEKHNLPLWLDNLIACAHTHTHTQLFDIVKGFSCCSDKHSLTDNWAQRGHNRLASNQSFKLATTTDIQITINYNMKRQKFLIQAFE